MLHMPVDVRSVSLAVLAVSATVVILDWAAEVFIPLLLGLMFSYALTPLVDRLQSWRVPRALSAAALLIAIIGGAAGTIYALQDDAAVLIASLPDTAQKLRQVLRPPDGTPTGAMANVQKAAAELERAAADGSAPTRTTRGVTRVQIEQPKFDIKDYVWTGTIGLVSFAGQAVAAVFITYFALVYGNTFRRKIVKIAGPTFAKRRITVEALDDITAHIKRYLLVQVLTSLIVGIATWLCFAWIGLQHAAVWGVFAGLMNLIPYVGAVVVTAGAALAALVQFGTADLALLVGLTSFAIQATEGHIVTPWLTSRASRMNPVVVFVGLLAWGWLWGVWGLLLAVPILVVIKSVCDRVDDLKAIGELLGE